MSPAPQLPRLPPLLQARLDQIQHSVGLFWEQKRYRHVVQQGTRHSEQVEIRLVELLNELPESSRLSSNELFVLVAATRLYDIGLQSPVLKPALGFDPLPGQTLSWSQLRQIHEHKRLLTYKLIHASLDSAYTETPISLGLSQPIDDYTIAIAELCRCCPSQHSDEADTEEIAVAGETVRLSLLANLLHLADALYIDRSRVNLDLLPYADLPITELAYWWCHVYAKAAGIHRGQIRFHYYLPEGKQEWLERVRAIIEPRFEYVRSPAIRFLWDRYDTRLMVDHRSRFTFVPSTSLLTLPDRVLQYLQIQESSPQEHVVTDSLRSQLKTERAGLAALGEDYHAVVSEWSWAPDDVEKRRLTRLSSKIKTEMDAARESILDLERRLRESEQSPTEQKNLPVQPLATKPKRRRRTVITIRELPYGPGQANAEVSFNHNALYRTTVTDPFSAGQRRLLSWYFGLYPIQPSKTELAKEAVASIRTGGISLFNQVFSNRRAYANYSKVLDESRESIVFEIIGSQAFQAIHWEALTDPDLPEHPLVYNLPMVRKSLTPVALPVRTQPSPTLNILLLTARPGMSNDVAYRTISRPLIAALHQSSLAVQVDIVRPGTYAALREALEEAERQHGSGHYHIVHLDAHGEILSYDSLLARLQNGKLNRELRDSSDTVEAYAGGKAFLSMESEITGESYWVSGDKVAELLIARQVPIVVLNACESAREDGEQAASLASELMRAGIQVVVAMAYTITTDSAVLFATTLYRQLFDGVSLSTAIRRSRSDLWDNTERQRNTDRVPLEDWLLPVVYQNQEVQRLTRSFEPKEEADYFQRHAARYKPAQPWYGKFAGRDSDILQIESTLTRSAPGKVRPNVLLLRGDEGIGKTTLLHHLSWWWQLTGFVHEVFYFDLALGVESQKRLIESVAARLLPSGKDRTSYEMMDWPARREWVAKHLRSVHHLIVLDHIPDAPPELADILADLNGGRTIVLLASRDLPGWLNEIKTLEVHTLGGLDLEAARELASVILERQGVERYREDPNLPAILKHLAGHPRQLEMILARLSNCTPSELRAELKA